MSIDYGIKEYIKVNNLSKDLNMYRIINKSRTDFKIANDENNILNINITSVNDSLVVGDFVELIQFDNENYIKKSYERMSIVSKAANTTKKDYSYNDNEQILASNVDQIFILIAADQRFTLSKFERYLLTFGNMAEEIVVLISKSDYDDNSQKIIETINGVYPNVKVRPYSIYNENSLINIKLLFKENKTAILVGSSGAGKSTLTNYLLSKKDVATQDVRSDGKGKHTTTSSTLYYLLKTNSYLIDTPGFKTISTSREIDEDILFEEISNLSRMCKFNDCKHETEPGCAVKKAIENGDLSSELYKRYLINKDKELKFKKFEEKKLTKKERLKRNKR